MQNKLPKRDEVALELTWRLEDIYDDESKWEEELKKAGVYDNTNIILNDEATILECIISINIIIR